MLQQGIPLAKGIDGPPEIILVNVMPQETRVAFFENNDLCEFHIEKNFSAGIVGNIYLGKVRRVLPGMQSAFIEIGLERAAFLHVVDLVENRINLDAAQQIEHTVFEGQVILVQVIKEPIGNKGARVTTQISLVGRYLVFLPQDNHIGISQRIEGEVLRESLKQKLDLILLPNHEGGFIIRTRAENATTEELASDVKFLAKLWNNIKQLSSTKPACSLVHRDLNLALRVLRDLVSDTTQQIIVDSEQCYREMKEFSSLYCHDVLQKITLYSDYPQQNLFDLYNVEARVNLALHPRVNLKYGGYLIIESTESMTTIDVNTGGFVGLHNFQETIFKTNLEACKVLARELRIRNIGGIIIIDFIDMDSDEHRGLILQELATALSYDKTKVTLNGFTALGLVELTRKRSRDSLKNALTKKCSACEGYGYVKSTQTICYEIMRLIVKEVTKYGYQAIKILASNEVIDAFLDEESKTLVFLGESLKVKITLTIDTNFLNNDYELFAV